MIIMDIMPTRQHSLILGMLWMETHDPWIRIADKDLMFTSHYCQENCLNIDPHVRIHQNPEPNEDAKLFGIDRTTFEDPCEHVLIELHEYLDGFNDHKAKKMPKDRGDWNFKIDFIEGWEKQLPKPAKRYRLTKAEQQAELETLQELQEARMIQPSRSPVAAPTFFIPKKDGSKRYVMDWRGINAITVKDAYPLPLLDDLLDMAQGATIMSKFDLTASYNQIPIREEDRWKTAFITSQGLFKFNVMHFGFCNAPPHMQRFMEHILRPVFHRNVGVYLDDIPVFSKTKEEHVETLKMVLQCLREEHLFAKAKKCEFMLPEIDLLGVKVSVQGFQMEEKKITEI